MAERNGFVISGNRGLRVARRRKKKEFARAAVEATTEPKNIRFRLKLKHSRYEFAVIA
jgi:hypothetical protein